MNDRIRQLRKTLKMTQDEFADAIGLTKNYISLVETGSRSFSSRTVSDVCRKFHVNEHWLCTGEGEMFAPSSDDELSKVADTYGLRPQERLLVENFVKLPAEARAVFVEYVANLAQGLSMHQEESAPEKTGADKMMYIADVAARSGDRVEVAQVSKEAEDAVLPPEYTGDI